MKPSRLFLSIAGAVTLLATVLAPVDAFAQATPDEPAAVDRGDKLPPVGHPLIDSVTHPFNDSIFAAMPGLPSPSAAARASAIATIAPVVVGLGLLAGNAEDPSGQTGALGVIAAGLVLGPSIGYFTGGCANRGIKGIAFRLALGAFTYAAGSAIAPSGKGGDGDWDFDIDALDGLSGGAYAGAAIFTAGAMAVVSSSIWDIDRVGPAVRENNLERMQTALSFRMGLLSDATPGVVVSLSF